MGLVLFWYVQEQNGPLQLALSWKTKGRSNFLYFLTVLYGLHDLSFLTRDWTEAPAVKAPKANHWTTREFPRMNF